MKIDVPDHARFRIMERHIDVDYAKKVVRSPDSLVIQQDGKIKATARLDDERILTIVYSIKTKNHMVIITGYYEN
jgi:Domain of unknown function (DUF4258)